MLLLLVALVALPRLHDTVEAGANELLRHLSLLFVPAGVGIMAAAHTVAGHGLAITLALVGSTLLTLAVTALVMRGVIGRGQAVNEGGDTHA
jgi:putative effector of murein hydrolase LrgA (UPF0299 family)